VRSKAPARLGARTRTFALLVAGVLNLATLSACSPSVLRIPAGEADTFRKIAVISLESHGIAGQGRAYFRGGGEVAYVAGSRDNAVLGKGFGAVVVGEVPVFFEISRIGPGGPGQAERFEKLVTGPRVRWIPAVDLAEIASRRLRAAGIEASAEREAVRIPGLIRRSSDGVPLDWWKPLNEWYGKAPDPLDLAGYTDRGVQAVLVVAPRLVVPVPRQVQLWLYVKLVDPADGRVIGRAAVEESGTGSASVNDFPAAFGSTARQAVEKALGELGLVRAE
jgi:hypothetical protein